MAFDSNKYKQQYSKEKYASVKVNIPKAKKKIIDELAATTGKSINRLFIEAVERVYQVDLTHNIDEILDKIFEE